mgnify:CR=1 FL=1
MITIKNLSFSYRQKEIFNNLDLTVPDGKITSIIGPNGSGKSTLVKILVGLYKYNGEIKINEIPLLKDNRKEIRKIIGVVFTNPENQFVAETVMDDIAFTLENMNFKKDIIRKKIEEISKYLGIYDILECNPHDLNSNQKQLVSLASALVHDPKILILDEALTMLDPYDKEKILKILKELNSKGLTILNITNDIEDTLISDEIYVLNEGKIVLNGAKEEVYKEEDKLHKLGFELPFMVELSNRLMFYDLIDHVIYDMEEMVDILWK